MAGKLIVELPPLARVDMTALLPFLSLVVQPLARGATEVMLEEVAKRY